MKSLLLPVLLAMLCIPASAQSPSTAGKKAEAGPRTGEDRPSQEQVLKLLELLKVRENMEITVDAMKEQVRGTAEQSFREKIPNPSAEQLKSVNAIVEGVFKDLVLEDLLKDVVPVYQRHLSRSDVQAVIAFYSSPAGKKILREEPAMIRESMQATSAGQRKKMEQLLVKLDVQMQQLIESEQNKSGQEKK